MFKGLLQAGLVAVVTLSAPSLPHAHLIPAPGEAIEKVQIRGATSSASTVYGPTGTIFLFPELWTDSDSSSFTSMADAGSGTRLVYDRRTASWNNINVVLFQAVFNYEGKSPVEVQVNPEFGNRESCQMVAQKYLPAVGRLPSYMRDSLDSITIHAGDNPWGGGNRNLLIHDGNSYYENNGILVETLAHELAHTSLDGPIYQQDAWYKSANDDNKFISDYARDYPSREDVAETYVAWYAARKVGADRVSQSNKDKVENGVPNRLNFLDKYLAPTWAPTSAPTEAPTFAPTFALTSAPTEDVADNNAANAIEKPRAVGLLLSFLLIIFQ